MQHAGFAHRRDSLIVARVLSCSVAVAQDTRGITISSSVDPTFKRVVVNGAATQALNTPDSEGNMQGDMLKYLNSVYPFDSTYYATVSGDWSAASVYHWYAGISGQSATGPFCNITPPGLTPIKPFPTNAPAGSLTDPKKQFHVFLSAEDQDTSSNTIRLTTNYNLFTHDYYEDWTPDNTKTVVHPVGVPDGANVAANPDWQFVFYIVNETTVPQQSIVTTTITKTDSKSGTINGETSAPILTYTFKVNANFTISEVVTYTVSQGFPFTGPPMCESACFWGPTVIEKVGTTSKWLSNGYQGDTAWSSREPTGVWSPAVVPVVFYQ